MVSPGASPEYAHGLLHHQGIAGQHDSTTVSACEAQLLLGHPQELTKSCCAEERQWYLELHAVSGLHYAVWPLPLTSTACCTTLQFLLPTLMTTRGRKQWLKGDDGDG